MSGIVNSIVVVNNTIMIALSKLNNNEMKVK
jgi:hypothetical protein